MKHIADRLEIAQGNNNADELIPEAATMLRQQQVEIKALKLQLHTTLTNRDLRTYDGKTEMNNEPVAWLINGKLFEEYFRTSELDKIIPLYTHPVKELTDAELSEVYEEVYINYAGKDFPVDLGRAILRKAQEK